MYSTHILILGSKITEHQSRGASLTHKLHSNRSNGKLLHFLACAVFAFKSNGEDNNSYDSACEHDSCDNNSDNADYNDNNFDDDNINSDDDSNSDDDDIMLNVKSIRSLTTKSAEGFRYRAQMIKSHGY